MTFDPKTALTFPSNNADSKAAIYVHWPFCQKKCPYCDFNSHVRDHISHRDWRQSLLSEIDTYAVQYPNIQASSIFFGGGTPSLMMPETVAAIIGRIQNYWGKGQRIEITLEANPSSIESAKFKEFAAAGVNRVSVGVQSLRDDALRFLGRLHSAAEARKSLDIARDNFNRVSFDLIYARPEHTGANALKVWEKELSEALSYAPSHVSLYQLTIEEDTAFYHQFQRGKFLLPDEDLSADLYALTLDHTKKAGLPMYEISNHARLGEESQHNLAYWQGLPYVGIGPGAHGRLPAFQGSAIAQDNIKRPEGWLKAVLKHGHGAATLRHVSAEDRFIENIMMGLRLKEGVNLTNLMSGCPIAVKSRLNISAINQLQDQGFLNMRENHKQEDVLVLSDTGLPLLNAILAKIIN